MGKMIIRLLMAALVLGVLAAQAQATLIITPFEHSQRSAWAEVIEVEGPGVSRVGSVSVFSVAGGTVPWNRGVWIFSTGSYVEAAFSTPAPILLVQFESDTNDGLADFIVDGVSQGILDTYNRGWFQVQITGLSNTAHTLRVAAAGPSPIGRQDDIAIDTFGALAPSAIPEPSTLLLLGMGLVGLAGYGRKFRK